MVDRVVCERTERALAGGSAVLLCSGVAMLLLFGSGALRYEKELVVNLGILAMLTAAFALLGGILVAFAALQCLSDKRIPRWVWYSVCGAAVAAVACASLAVVANCVPQCEGRGSLAVGLALAIPAGFAAGAICNLVLEYLRALARAINRSN